MRPALSTLYKRLAELEKRKKAGENVEKQIRTVTHLIQKRLQE